MQYDVVDYETMHASIASLCRFLESEGVSEGSIFDCRLVASELLANVLQHAKAQARLCGSVEDGHVHVTVYSTKTYVPKPQTERADVYAERGRGMYIVDTVCVERTLTDDGGILVKIRIR